MSVSVRPSRLRRATHAVLAVLALVLVSARVGYAQHDHHAPAAVTTVILVRHAERAAEPGNDPALSEAGLARSRALADVLLDFPVDAVITTQFKRTQLTAAQVAQAHRLALEVVSSAGNAARHAEAVAAAVRRHAGHTVLVVGHSNTVPAIIAALGGPRLPDLCDNEYASLFVMMIPPSGAPRLLRSRYGAADEPVEGCPAMMGR